MTDGRSMKPSAEDAAAPAAAAAAPARRLGMLAGDAQSGERCRTFIFKGESHTLGNALKNVLLQNNSVAFCGYSIPHPAEDQMYLRIQTTAGATAQDALRKGFEDLEAVCGSVDMYHIDSVAV